ncbi:MAG: hypothetical protein JXA10_14350, partial [Anaerolineae bacterium]|nr:hypothetical protein [Anaerolineae bacterium]
MIVHHREKQDKNAVKLILLITVAGLGLRLLLLIVAGWRYDYDEGMVGLQVLHILDGDRPIFHPGQPYLAALESYLIAPIFAVFGANAVTLKIVPWLLSGGYVATTGWLGWRAFDRRVGVLSTLLAAFAPSYLLVGGMKTWGATAETLLLGNLLLIAASYALEKNGTQIHTDDTDLKTKEQKYMLLLGLLGGIAFWVSWLSTFYAMPILIAFMIYRRDLLHKSYWPIWTQAGLAFVIGSAPFWGYNLTHHFETFRYLLSDQGDTWSNAWAVLDHLNYDLSPRLVSGDPKWRLLSWPAIWWLQIVYEGGLVALLILAWRKKSFPTRALLAIFTI